MTQPRILVAEDEHIIAFDLCDTVEEAGYTVEGPHTDNSSAMLACQKDRPDLAILDLRLVDGETLSVASLLADHGVPIVFHSGHMSDGDWDSPHAAVLYCGKPCSETEMKRALLSAARMS